MTLLFYKKNFSLEIENYNEKPRNWFLPKWNGWQLAIFVFLKKKQPKIVIVTFFSFKNSFSGPLF